MTYNPSAETLSLSAANANLPPEKNLSYEAGTKWDLAGQKLSMRTALFRTEKTNAREPDPNLAFGAQRCVPENPPGVEVDFTAKLEPAIVQPF